MFAHPANLAIQPLHQGDTKHKRRFFFHFALLRHRAENRYARPHAADKLIGHRLINGDQILFFVIVTGAQDFIHQIAMVGQKDQPLGVFIQATDGENAFAVVYEINDVVAFAVFGSADDANRFIQRNQDQIVRFARLNQPAIDLYHVARFNLVADGSALAVDKNVALFDKAIGFTTRANSAFADVFIESG